MDTSWWPAAAAVVALAVIAGLADSWGRLSRAHRGQGPGLWRRPGALPRPRQGEIWWAEMPVENGTGTRETRDLPCLVIKVQGGSATVAGITTKYDERPGVIPLPPGAVGDAEGRPSYLEADEVREADVRSFRSRAGQVDPAIWDQVKYLAES